MVRSLRSRQVSVLADSQADVERSTKTVLPVRTTSKKPNKANSNEKKVVRQDENIVASTVNKKLRSFGKESLADEDPEIVLKSPALRDRTNTTKNHSNITEKIVTSKMAKNKVPTKKSTLKSNTKTSKAKVTDSNSLKLPDATCSKDIIPRNCKVVVENTIISKYLKSKLVTEHGESDEKKTNTLDVSTSSNTDKEHVADDGRKGSRKQSNPPVNTRSSKNMKISVKALEHMMNSDDESGDKDINIESKKSTEKSENTKFFKQKALGLPSIISSKSNANKRTNTKRNKKEIIEDSSFSCKDKELPVTSSAEKKLRPRAIKNYCEITKLLEDLEPSGEQEITVKDKKSMEEESDKKDEKYVPIYKTLKQSQENFEDKDKIYEFPEDSGESKKISKKKKKPVKRLKKAQGSRAVSSRKIKNGATMKQQKAEIKEKSHNNLIPIKVNLEVEKQKPLQIETHIQKSPQLKSDIPVDYQDAGEETIEQAPTIRIISDKRLENSNKIKLTVTPSIPKTITSELKLYGPTNAITSKPKTQFSNMLNHSLIRKSMSPITKTIENFDAGSPWRPQDAFSRVNRMVQSTPQLHRIPLVREKKIIPPKEKSIYSEDTIHVSSNVENESSNKPEIPVAKPQNFPSPRKFGTVLSNLSPVKSVSNQSLTSNNSPLKNVVGSPLQVLTKSPVEQDEVRPIPLIQGRENKSPKKSPKKKVIKPVNNELVEISNNSPKPNSKSKSLGVSRQTNLHSFLNLTELPESATIRTPHGIFDDLHSTPINGKKLTKPVEEPNIENAFGFDDFDSPEVSPVKTFPKNKVLRKPEVKSNLPTRISANTVKKALLKDVVTKKSTNPPEKIPDIFNEPNIEDDSNNFSQADSFASDINETSVMKNDGDDVVNAEKAALEAASFLNTFDMADFELQTPENIPLFVDPQPAHFKQPPRRSFCKRKRQVCFKVDDRNDSDSDEETEYEKPKQIKKKKKGELTKEEKKQMQEWVKSINNTFEEIDHFDLVVE